MARAKASTKSLRSKEHRALIGLLKKARLGAELTQEEVAARLGRPQSFVAKYEGGERRLDVIELLAVCRALEVDVCGILKQVS